MAVSEAAGLKASVCICTYNGKARIGEVLSALTRQTLDFSEWEVVVVDNASTDGTAEFVKQILNRDFGALGRVVAEDRPGLSHARARAAREANGQIICFLDDDNVPTPEFVSSAVQAFLEHPSAGVVGGKVVPQWQTPPPPLVEVVAPFALAICDLGDTAKRINMMGGGIVGAGMCVRTELLRRIYAKPEIAAQVSGRKGKSLVGGEDLVISIIAGQLGWECWYVPALQIGHVLPASRMDKKYLLRLYEGIGRGQAAVRKCYDWKARSPLAWLISFKDFARWQAGRWHGPAPEVKKQYPKIAGDLHDLNLRLTWGRASQALYWFK